VTFICSWMRKKMHCHLPWISSSRKIALDFHRNFAFKLKVGGESSFLEIKKGSFHGQMVKSFVLILKLCFGKIYVKLILSLIESAPKFLVWRQKRSGLSKKKLFYEALFYRKNWIYELNFIEKLVRKLLAAKYLVIRLISFQRVTLNSITIGLILSADHKVDYQFKSLNVLNCDWFS